MLGVVARDGCFRRVGILPVRAGLLLSAALCLPGLTLQAQDAPPRTAPATDAGVQPDASVEPRPDAGVQPEASPKAPLDAGAQADAAPAPPPVAGSPPPAATEPPATGTPPAVPGAPAHDVAEPAATAPAPTTAAVPEVTPPAAATSAAAAEPPPTAAPAQPASPTPPDASATCPAGAALSGELSARGSADWITAARGVLSPKHGLNGSLMGAQTELRPNLRLELGSSLQAVAQLRFGIEGSSTYGRGEWPAPQRSYVAKIAQLYAQWRFNENVSLAMGFQDFQWGPAELITPSNRLFRVLSLLRDPLFIVYGRGLVRVNLSVGKSLSAVILTEVLPNGEPAFVSGEGFKRNALAKLEYSAADGGAYIGITGGAKETGRGWFGEYASWSLTDGFSLYADASHTSGSEAWYPQRILGTSTPTFVQSLRESKRLRTLAVLGARYTFESGVDVRVEYLFNDGGYSKDQMALAASAAAVIPSRPELAGPYAYPGYEILARHLVYVSLRIPDLPPDERSTVHARYLTSITDGSGAAVLSLTVDVADRYTLFLSALATHGPSYGEFARLAGGYALVGLTVSI